jgi:hypothetical protein
MKASVLAVSATFHGPFLPVRCGAAPWITVKPLAVWMLRFPSAIKATA